MILEHILSSSIIRNVRSNSVEKMHVDVGARRVNHTTFHFTPSREKISVSNDLVNGRDYPFLVLDVFDPQ